MFCIAVDIETTPFDRESTPKFLFAGAFDGTTYHVFSTADELNNFIWKQDADTIVLFHNLSFDVFIAIEQFKPPAIKTKFTNVYGPRPRFAIFCCERKKANGDRKRQTVRNYIYFIDTMNFFSQGLKKLMPIFYPAGVEAKSTGKFDTARNEADCRCTWLIYDSIRQILGYNTYTRHGRERPFISASQLAYYDLIQRTGYSWARNDKKRLIHRYPWLKAVEKAAYHGGMVFVNPDYRYKRTLVHAYDVNSEYPFIMRNLKVPVDYDMCVTVNLTDTSAAKAIVRSFADKENSVCLFEIDAITADFCLPGAYPIVDEKGNETDQFRLEAKIGPVRGWYCENELVACLDKLTSLQIKRIVIYKAKKGLFAPFVDFWYQRKQTATNPIERSFAKLILNSAYGKFAQRKRIRQTIDEGLMNTEMAHARRITVATLDKTHQLQRMQTYQREFDQYFTNECSTDEIENAITIISALVTAGGRALIMNTTPMADTVYIDTDSLYLTKELNATLIDQFALGKFKKEGVGFITPVAKKYYFFEAVDPATVQSDQIPVVTHRIRKCKGVPSTAIEIGPHKYQFTKITSVKESIILKTNPAAAYTEREVIKDLNAGLQRKTGTTPVTMDILTQFR